MAWHLVQGNQDNTYISVHNTYFLISCALQYSYIWFTQSIRIINIKNNMLGTGDHSPSITDQYLLFTRRHNRAAGKFQCTLTLSCHEDQRVLQGSRRQDRTVLRLLQLFLWGFAIQPRPWPRHLHCRWGQQGLDKVDDWFDGAWLELWAGVRERGRGQQFYYSAVQSLNTGGQRLSHLWGAARRRWRAARLPTHKRELGGAQDPCANIVSAACVERAHVIPLFRARCLQGRHANRGYGHGAEGTNRRPW